MLCYVIECQISESNYEATLTQTESFSKRIITRGGFEKEGTPEIMDGQITAY